MAEMTPEQPTFTVGTDLSDGKLSVVVMKHENGTTWVIHSEVIQLVEQQPELTKYQPCGCVVCTCEHETQCQGCGAKHCGTHPVGQIPEPVYQQPAPDVAGLVEALESLVKGYVNLLEAGKDRITSLGGDCDPVPVMEHNDPWLRDARVALAPYRKGVES